MDFQPIRKESPLLMIYDDFSREFYRLLMNLNHELQMSLENQSLLGESGYDRFVPTVTYQKSQLALTMGFNQYANHTYVKHQNDQKTGVFFVNFCTFFIF